MKTVPLIVCILVVCLAAISGAAHYTIVDLGTLGGFSAPTDINDHGQVVGYSETGSIGTGWRAFLAYGNQMDDLGQIRSGNNIALGINNVGQVVGSSGYYMGRAFLWDNGTINDLGALIDDPSAVSDAQDINDLGQVVGSSNGISWWRPFLWENGVMRDLGTPGGDGVAAAINNQGQVVGWFGPAARACIWQNGSVTDLGTFGGSLAQALDINENGEVLIGVEGPDTEHTFIWKDGQATDLNTLGARVTDPLDMNDACQIVGVGFAEGSATPVGCLWDGEKMVDLAKHLPPEWNLMIQYGCAINNEGQIACTAMLPDFRVHAVLLTPEPEAISVTMEIKPNTLNPKSKGKYVTAYIELPAGVRGLQDIEVSSLRLNATIQPAAERQPQIGDYDSDGIPDLMVKFGRETFSSLVSAGQQAVILTGVFGDGACLTGQDTIRVLEK